MKRLDLHTLFTPCPSTRPYVVCGIGVERAVDARRRIRVR
jgi:hypothetical protein